MSAPRSHSRRRESVPGRWRLRQNDISGVRVCGAANCRRDLGCAAVRRKRSAMNTQNCPTDYGPLGGVRSGNRRGLRNVRDHVDRQDQVGSRRSTLGSLSATPVEHLAPHQRDVGFLGRRRRLWRCGHHRPCSRPVHRTRLRRAPERHQKPHRSSVSAGSGIRRFAEPPPPRRPTRYAERVGRPRPAPRPLSQEELRSLVEAPRRLARSRVRAGRVGRAGDQVRGADGRSRTTWFP